MTKNINSRRLQKAAAGLVILTFLAGGCGLRYTLPPVGERNNVKPDMTAEAERWADSVIAGMSGRELAAQLVMPAIYAKAGEDEERQLKVYACSLNVGGILLLQGNLAEARSVADSIIRWSGILPFVAIDGEWGLRMRLQDAPCFPANGAINPGATENALYEYGEEMARECRSVGVNMLLGPVLDVLGTSKPRGGMSYRSFGSDSQRAARFGIAYARGLEDGNVVSVAKHFPGHGRATDDSHRALPVIVAAKEELDTTDLVPFRRYAETGLSAVMTGHLSVPALDPTGKPATVSSTILKELLRDEIGFDGLIITDAMNMAAVREYSAADAISAGADIVLAPTDTRAAIDGISALEPEILRERARRVLVRKFLLKGVLPPRADTDSLEKGAEKVRKGL